MELFLHAFAATYMLQNQPRKTAREDFILQLAIKSLSSAYTYVRVHINIEHLNEMYLDTKYLYIK